MEAEIVELSVSPTYVPDWGMYEAVREILQNARDQEKLGNPMSVRYEEGSLIVTTSGTELSRRALLLGHQDDTPELTRRHGEGLKLALLALARQLRGVEVLNGERRWCPTLRRSQVYDADVLAIRVTMADAGRARPLQVRVIVPMTEEEWTDLQLRFLWLRGVADEERIDTESGTILLAGAHRGQLYHDGNYVAHLPGQFQYGYDLADIKLDRDRSVPDGFSLLWELRRVWAQAMNGEFDGESAHLLVDAMLSGSVDAGLLDASNVPERAKEHIRHRWSDVAGEGVVPAAGTEVAALEAQGVRTRAIAHEHSLNLLREVVGRPDAALSRVAQLSTRELTDGEFRALIRLRELVTWPDHELHAGDLTHASCRAILDEDRLVLTICRSLLVEDLREALLVIAATVGEEGGSHEILVDSLLGVQERYRERTSDLL